MYPPFGAFAWSSVRSSGPRPNGVICARHFRGGFAAGAFHVDALGVAGGQGDHGPTPPEQNACPIAAPAGYELVR
jgi:hypothetical protein